MDGRVEADVQTALSFDIPGRLEAVEVRRGDVVKAGDVLAENEVSARREELDALLAGAELSGSSGLMVEGGGGKAGKTGLTVRPRRGTLTAEGSPRQSRRWPRSGRGGHRRRWAAPRRCTMGGWAAFRFAESRY